MSKNLKRSREEKTPRKSGKATTEVTAPSPVATTEKEPTTQEREGDLTLLVSKAFAGEPQGVLRIALNHDETALAVARTTGSIQLYRIVAVGGIFHFVLQAHTGGQTNMTITGLEWSEDGTVILASLLSGQIILYSGSSMQPVGLQHRSGGAIRALCKVNNNFLVANGDGMWRQYSLSGTKLELEQTAHSVGEESHRALSVDADVKLRLACGSDDGGNVVAWQLKLTDIRDYRQLWVCKLPNGYAHTVKIVPRFDSIAAGTSIGSVMFINATAGVITNKFTHHKGPVTCLATFGGCVYASGRHESLRCYKNEKNHWFPAEVKRRTHYHEATDLAIGGQSGLFLSASRDGTVMFTNLHKLFTNPASYIDCSGQQFMYSNNILAHNSGKAIEAYTCNEDANLWLPLFKYQTKTKQHIKGLWCNSDFTIFSVAVDTKITFLKMKRTGDLGVDLEALCSIDTPCVNDVIIVGNTHAYVAAPNCVLYVDFAMNVNSTFQTKFTPLKLVLEDSSSSLVLFGVSAKQKLSVAADTGVLEANEPAEASDMLNVAAVDGVVISQQFETGMYAPDRTREKGEFSCNAPVDSKVFGSKGKFFFGNFSRGVLAATRGSKSWHMVKRSSIKAAFQRSDNELLILERNLEETLENLPDTWKVRRFGN